MDENSNVVRLRHPDEIDDPLTNILRSGARQLLAQAIELEAEVFLASMKDLRLADGRDRVVRHGHRSGPALEASCYATSTVPKLGFVSWKDLLRHRYWLRSLVCRHRPDFQKEGVAEADLQRDVRETIRRVLGGAVDSQGNLVARAMAPRHGGWLDSGQSPPSLPRWLGETDIDFYTGEFQRTGFRGGLNWYRNIDRNWELMAPWSGAKVTVPALYMAGERDLVVRFPGAQQLIANLGQLVPKLQKTIMLPDCGHWTQQEKPDEVNSALIMFLRDLTVTP